MTVTPQELVEHALAASTSDDCIALVRDAMAGDLTSSTTKALEATLKAASLAAGVASGLFVTGRF